MGCSSATRRDVRGQEDPIRLAREFKRRFGDATPLVLGNARFTAEELTAVMLRHVVDFVAEREGGRPDQVVVAHPANWGEYRRELLRRDVTRAVCRPPGGQPSPTPRPCTTPAASG